MDWSGVSVHAVMDPGPRVGPAALSARPVVSMHPSSPTYPNHEADAMSGNEHFAIPLAAFGVVPENRVLVGIPYLAPIVSPPHLQLEHSLLDVNAPTGEQHVPPGPILLMLEPQHARSSQTRANNCASRGIDVIHVREDRAVRGQVQDMSGRLCRREVCHRCDLWSRHGNSRQKGI
jgi:hypothetical protein